MTKKDRPKSRRETKKPTKKPDKKKNARDVNLFMEGKYQQLFGSVIGQFPAVVYVNTVGDPTYTRYVSPQIQSLLGYSQEEWLADPKLWSKRLHPQDRKSVLEKAKRLGKSKKDVSIEYRLLAKDNRVVWVQDQVSMVFDEQEEPQYWQGLLQDITERKHAEAALQLSEARYRQLFEEMTDGFALHEIIVDDENRPIDYRFLEVNSSFEHLTGLKAKNVIGHTVLEILPNLESAWIERYGRVALTGEPVSFEDYAEELDRYYLVKAFCPEIGKFAVLFEDITARKEGEKRIDRFGRIFDESLNEIYLFAIDTLKFTQVNSAAQHNLGYTMDELLNLTPLDLKPEFTAETFAYLIAPLLKGEKEKIVFETVHKRKDQSLYDVEVHLQLLKYENEETFAAIILDITDRKVAERAIYESEEKYRTLFENVPVGVYRTTREGKILAANQALVQILGHDSVEDLMKHDVYDFYFDPKIRDHYTREIVDKGGIRSEEISLKRKNGQRIIGLENSRAVYDERGNFIHFEGTIIDITERKQAEKAVEDQAKELERLYNASGSLMLRKSLDSQSLAQTIVETILKEFDKTNCSLLLVQEHSSELHRIAIAGPYRKELSNRTLSLDGKGLVPEAIRSRQLINVPDVSSREDYVANWKQARSELVIPLEVDEKVIGAIDVQSKEENAFSADDERLIMVFAKQAAMTLERARLFETEQRRAMRLNALQNLATKLATLHSEEKVLDTLVKRGAELAESPACTVMLLDEGEAHLVAQTGLPDGTPPDLRVPIQLPIIQHAIETKEPIIISDIDNDAPAFRQLLVRTDINAFYAFPILNEEIVTGFITLSSLVPKTLSEAEKTTYELLAKLASEALRSARLFERTNRNLERLASLRAVDMAIAASFDISVSLDVLLQQVTDKLQVDAACILLHDPDEHSLKFVRNRGFRTQALRHTNLRMGEGFSGQVALKRRIIHILDLEQEHHELKRSPAFSDEGFVSYLGIPLVAKGIIKGVLEVFHRKRLSPDQEWLDFLETMASQAAIAIDSAEMFQDLQQSNVELSLAYDNTLEGWAKALELRDEETEGHTRRVTDLTIQLATLMGVKNSDFLHIRRGALLHDIGKMGIPDSILLKPGPLTDEEWVIMRKHPEYAYTWLSRISYLRPALDIPYCHHEKWDGSGYPRGLKGEQIPLAARIFAVVDVWDALCSDRPYRKAWSREKALDYIREQSGSHFDPAIVEAFLQRIAKGNGQKP